MDDSKKGFLDKVVDYAEEVRLKPFQDNPLSKDYLEIKEATTGIGRRYPQTNIISLVMAHAIKHASFPETEIDLDKITLHDSAKVTDFISTGAIAAHGFMLSKKALDVFTQFDLGNYKIYPATIEHRGECYPYGYLQVVNDQMSHIDFTKSSFFFGSYMGQWICDIVIKDITEYGLKKKQAGEGELAESQRKGLLQLKQAVFHADHTLPDFFSISGTSITKFISVRLAEALRKTKLTGYETQATRRIVSA